MHQHEIRKISKLEYARSIDKRGHADAGAGSERDGWLAFSIRSSASQARERSCGGAGDRGRSVDGGVISGN